MFKILRIGYYRFPLRMKLIQFLMSLPVLSDTLNVTYTCNWILVNGNVCFIEINSNIFFKRAVGKIKIFGISEAFVKGVELFKEFTRHRAICHTEKKIFST